MQNQHARSAQQEVRPSLVFLFFFFYVPRARDSHCWRRWLNLLMTQSWGKHKGTELQLCRHLLPRRSPLACNQMNQMIHSRVCHTNCSVWFSNDVTSSRLDGQVRGIRFYKQSGSGCAKSGFLQHDFDAMGSTASWSSRSSTRRFLCDGIVHWFRLHSGANTHSQYNSARSLLCFKLYSHLALSAVLEN